VPQLVLSPNQFDASQRHSNWRRAINQDFGFMKFADFVCFESTRANLGSESKEAVIRELVEALIAAGSLASEESEGILKAIMKREELGSTGIGRGIAVPHTKHPSVKKLVGAVGVSAKGVEFESLDGEKVYLLFLLISPPDLPVEHLRALENISRQLRDDMFCKFLKNAKTVEEIQTVLREADAGKFVS
jgi:PTS system nitrogen regulatory IIA component